MHVSTQPKKVGISLLLAAFLNSACALQHPSVQSQLSAGEALPLAAPALPPAAIARISPEEAAIRAVNSLTATLDGYELHHPHYTATFRTDGVTFQPKRGEIRWQWHLTEVGTTAGPLEGVAAEKVWPEQTASHTVVYRRGVLDEQYVARKGSIEQQFVLPQPLALQGADLRIRGQVQSGGMLESRDERWVWRGEDKGVWLGQVRVYDAQGTVLPSRLEVSQGETTIVIDGQGLAQAVYPVMVDPEIGVNDFRISDMGPNKDSSFKVFEPAVAYNTINNEYLVVWRGNDNTGNLADDENEIFGQRIEGATGAEVGVNDFRLSDMGPDGSILFEVYDPAVAYNSTNNQYLVVWVGEDSINGSFEVYGQRLAGATGAEIGTNDFRLSDMDPDGSIVREVSHPAVAYNSTNKEYLVVWQGIVSTSAQGEDIEIFGQRIEGATGAEVGVNDFRISQMGPDGDPFFDALEPAVAYNSTNNEYLVVWRGDDNINDSFEVYGQRLAGATGAEIGTNDFRLSDVESLSPAVAYNNTNNEYLVVWKGDINPDPVAFENEIFGQRIDGATGAEIGVNDFRLSDMGPDGDHLFRVYEPSVAYNSTNNEYLVVWEGIDNTGNLVPFESEIFGQRIDGATGAEIGVNDFRLSDMGPDGDAGFYAFEPAIAYNSTNSEYLVVWRGNDNTDKLVLGEYEIYGQRWSNCGDGVVDEGEECEPGDEIGIGAGSCTASCTINLCGNGVVDEDEDCDLGLGNGLPDSQCTFTCQHPSLLNLERLHDLVASCEICPPEVRGSLVDILSHAQLQLGKGNERGTLKTLKQFMKKVQHFLSKGRLPDAEGRRLQMQAEVIIAQLEEQLAGR